MIEEFKEAYEQIFQDADTRLIKLLKQKLKAIQRTDVSKFGDKFISKNDKINF